MKIQERQHLYTMSPGPKSWPKIGTVTQISQAENPKYRAQRSRQGVI